MRERDGTHMTKTTDALPGVHFLPPREAWTDPARKLRDTYACTPGAPLFQREFGFYCLERWHEQGLAPDVDLAAEFGYDPPGHVALMGLGWCEAAFVPEFEEAVLEDRGEHEVVQDKAGRGVLCFKGRRSGFMPEYVDHPVKDQRTWEEDVKWRLDPAAPGRFEGLEGRMRDIQTKAAQGFMVQQRCIGGYMYLRSLLGPGELLMALCEQPALIEDCMETWFHLADAVMERHQQYVTFDELYLAEDICYRKGPLISPEMMRGILFPYYRQLIANIRSRQLDPDRHLYLQIDTDGFADPVIPVYQELGMDAMSPFEVAAGCDVVRTACAHPGLALFGGIDKRVLATTPQEIDAMIERILPPLRARGGYIPTCDHGVPEEVSLMNYHHYRKRCIELGG